MTRRKKPKNTSKLQSFAENRRNDIVVNVTNASALGIIIQWLFTNKVSIILFTLLSISVGSYYRLQTQYLEEKNQVLIEERDEILDRTAALQKKIAELEKDKQIASGLNKEVQDQAEKLTASQKRRKIKQQIRSLKLKRGILK